MNSDPKPKIQKSDPYKKLESFPKMLEFRKDLLICALGSNFIKIDQFLQIKLLTLDMTSKIKT